MSEKLNYLIFLANGLPAHRTGYSNGNTNGNYAMPISDPADSESRSSWAEDTYRRCCSKKVLYKRIPILNLMENYQKNMIMSDLVAGITVGLTMIPQAIAYASVAGVPPKVNTGIYVQIRYRCHATISRTFA